MKLVVTYSTHSARERHRMASCNSSLVPV